ncbi:hypothetical protein FOMPIDRAFT_1047987 [Fomitopsis schrenkii]|uniref:Uncharacterized protein n=1 Tax=Fomitopsis schrenkii TaxID=2126942 RepID=S8FLR5_FOMSC|nr:hypothetical protein FOMPIDRAFT_1047987 [Fomitopsis schrenkii]
MVLFDERSGNLVAAAPDAGRDTTTSSWHPSTIHARRPSRRALRHKTRGESPRNNRTATHGVGPLVELQAGPMKDVSSLPATRTGCDSRYTPIARQTAPPATVGTVEISRVITETATTVRTRVTLELALAFVSSVNTVRSHGYKRRQTLSAMPRTGRGVL